MTTARNVLLTCALALCAASERGARADGEPKRIEITARRFEFTPGEVTLHVGEPVKLALRSEDVEHGLFMAGLGIDADIRPGQTTELVITPAQAGRFTSICHRFCGSGHGGMKMTFVVVERGGAR